MSTEEGAVTRRTSVARGTVLGITAQFWQLLTAFLLYHFLADLLGPKGFGQWRVTLSVLNYLEMLLYSGLVQVAAKRLAQDPGNRAVIERGSYFAQSVLAGTLFVGLQLGAGVIASLLREPDLEPFIRIAALDLPFIAAFVLASSIRLGRHDFARQAFGMTVYSTAKFVAIGALVWRGFSVPGALVGNAVASIVGFIVMFTPWERVHVSFKRTLGEARGMGLEAVPFLTQSLVAGAFGDSGLWFVQAFRGSATAGLYGAAAALSEISTFLFAGLSRVLFPSVARAGAEKEEGLVARYATQGVRLALFISVLGVAVIAATGREALVFVYTLAFAAAAPAFTVLMIAAVGHNVLETCTSVLMARGQRRQALTIIIVATVFEVALLAVVTPRYGLVGAASVAALSAALAGTAAVWTLRALLGARVGWTLLRTTAAAAVVGAGLALAHPVGFWLIPAYLVAGAVYVALLLLFREIDSDDLRSLRAVATKTG